MMKPCANGHLYDESRYAKCPYCDGSNGNRTMPLNAPAQMNKKTTFPSTAPVSAPAPSVNAPINSQMTETVAPGMGGNLPTSDIPLPTGKLGPIVESMSSTVYIGTESEAAVEAPVETFRETVGWLVVMTKAQRGRSYQLYPQNNHVGRGDKFIVNLDFDPQVSSSGDIIISYNPRNCSFSVRPIDDAKNISYLNDEELFSPSKLKDYDKLSVGATELIFRSFCNEEHSYSDYAD